MKTYVVGTHLKCLAKVLLMSTHNMFSWRKQEKYYLDTPLIELEQCISKRAKLRVNIFSTSQLLIDDQ